MNLRETMQRHARHALVRGDHHGEPVTYTPQGSDTPFEGVVVVVNRRDVEPAVPGVTRVARLLAEVFLPRGDGITGPAAVAPGDTMTLAMRIGSDPVVARVTEILSQDEGAFVVVVKA